MLGERREQLFVVACVRLRLSGVAGRLYAGRAAKGCDTQTGIICQRRHTREAGGMARLGDRVFDESDVRLFRFRNVEFPLRDQFPAERCEDRVEFLEFLGIVRGEDNLHFASAAFCESMSWAMPALARSVNCSSWARVNGSPSAVPCNSTIPPAPVMITFMSVSQSESSG